MFQHVSLYLWGQLEKSLSYNLNFTHTHTSTQKKKLFVAIRLHIIERVMAPLSFLTARGLSLKLQWFTLTNVTALFAPTLHFIHSSSSFLSLSLHSPLSSVNTHFSFHRSTVITTFIIFSLYHHLPITHCTCSLLWMSLTSPETPFSPRPCDTLREGKAERADPLVWYGESLSQIIGVLLWSAAPNCCVPQGPYEAIKQAISEDACAVTR